MQLIIGHQGVTVKQSRNRLLRRCKRDRRRWVTSRVFSGLWNGNGNERTMDTRNPFGRREILTDGKNVFVLGLDNKGAEAMVEVLSRQKVFVEILLPFLKRIDYDSATRLAKKWFITDEVVLDPLICLGKPIVEKPGIATAILAASFQANNQDAGVVADWYGVQQSQVLGAVEFERSLAA